MFDVLRNDDGTSSNSHSDCGPGIVRCVGRGTLYGVLAINKTKQCLMC